MSASVNAAPQLRQIDIGRDFSKALGPRERSVGAHSGQQFFEEILEPAYLKNDLVVILLDAIDVPSASFFDEAFGGLVRKYGLDNVENKLRFSAVRKAYLVPKIQGWMRKAAAER